MNMSYCRFQNTANDLDDCRENISDELSKEEDAARKRLIKICRDIVDAADNGDIPETPTENEEED